MKKKMQRYLEVVRKLSGSEALEFATNTFIKEKALTSFKIKASKGSRYYYLVNLWRTQAAMQKHCDWFSLGKGCRGAVSSYESNKRRYILGEINLQKNHLDVELITHESCHAGLFYLARIGKTQAADKKIKSGTLHKASFDETLCYSVGYIAAELVRILRKRKFIE
jgi:hypothetical protein